MSDLVQPFTWHGFDVRRILPSAFAEQIFDVANEFAKAKTIVPTSVISREGSDVKELPVLTVGGSVIREQLPWLVSLYENEFRDLGQRCETEPVSIAKDERYAINLNVQRGKVMRYEAHVDSNPLEGLLYVTTHPEGAGGELVVGNRLDVSGIEEIEADNTRVYPVSGHLIFFNASKHSHYVAPLRSENDTRIVIAMNFYTPNNPEEARPADLNDHLGIS